MLSQITGTFKASVPQIFLISPPYRKIYNYLLILLFLLALSAFFAASLVAFFLMAMNPRSERHWRHMTLGVYLVLLSQVLIVVFITVWGSSNEEMAFVIWPLTTGTSCLMYVLCMRKSREGKSEGMGVDKLDAEEKMS